MSDASIAFADIAGFTALTEAHGDDHAAAMLGRYYALAEASLCDGAQIVKHIGDAVMVWAPTPLAAVRSARRLMRSVDGEPDWPALRVGIHAGPVVEKSGDYFGTTVNTAARVAAQAHSGQLLCTRSVVRGLAATEFAFRPLGDLHLKNLHEPVTIFELADEASMAAADIDPVCRMRVDRVRAPARLPFRGQSYSFCSLKCAQAFAADPLGHVKA
ncbi:MAG: adenylate/guanylate cyclase domain-containing protein [Myxococcota bacterium]